MIPERIIIGRVTQMTLQGARGLCATGLAWLALVGPAQAQRIENQVAVFAALDKVTARIQKLEVKLGETQKFGALKITPKVCYSRSATEAPKTTTFVQVEEIQLDGSQKRIFSGWMFAESPGLNAMEHPVFDVWLTDCGSPKAIAAAAPPAKQVGSAQPKPGTQPPAATAPLPPAGEDDQLRRRRPPR